MTHVLVNSLLIRFLQFPIERALQFPIERASKKVRSSEHKYKFLVSGCMSSLEVKVRFDSQNICLKDGRVICEWNISSRAIYLRPNGVTDNSVLIAKKFASALSSIKQCSYGTIYYP